MLDGGGVIVRVGLLIAGIKMASKSILTRLKSKVVLLPTKSEARRGFLRVGFTNQGYGYIHMYMHLSLSIYICAHCSCATNTCIYILICTKYMCIYIYTHVYVHIL